MVREFFHPIISQWFAEKIGEPTEPQRRGWPRIAENQNTLIAAPTGSGKTLAAFLVCIDRLVQEGMAGTLKDECKILYLSPLKALATDVRKNLEVPLAEIVERVNQVGFKLPEIRTRVRTGDTPPAERQALLRKPPHILVTTPESFYLLLTSEKGRKVLRTIETVIVDEIHALARDKRGSHLTLSLERLKALTKKPPTLIGLSATQKPVEEIASFLVGTGNPCMVVDVGHTRQLDLGIWVPESSLSTLCSGEHWEQIYQNLAKEIRSHRSTLIFVNTRRLAERVAFRLTEILGEDQVLSHHGSLSKARRVKAETLLKEGKLCAIVATASLELGIDIGYIDLVCQIGTPFSIATFLQRVGRSGHAIRATPKGRLVPLTRDELLESFALIKCIREEVLDKIEIPEAPVDTLAQQLIAEAAARSSEESFSVEAAYQLIRGAYPYRNISFERFLSVVQMAADGYATGRRRFAYLIWDRIQNRLSARAGARLAAITSGGAIPEMGDYRVVLEEDGTVVGSVNEDFAIESLAGDIFLLGTHSWRVRYVRGSDLVVIDAEGQPPSIPFWLGESPGRTKEFSQGFSDLRREVGDRIPDKLKDDPFFAFDTLEQVKELPATPLDEAILWLQAICGIEARWAALQAAYYIGVQKFALGLIPTREKIVFERFFDETGGMQLVVHSPYGTRINRAWGLALRKRFCRSFDFELQASADDDGILLSLGPQQSFPIEQLFKFLTPENAEPVLVQALLAAPMFGARWRWNSTRALAILRQSGGKRVAPALQRFRAEDLLTAVFPAQTACQENRPGDIEIPDHPLVEETVKDCLTEAMDIEGLRDLLRAVSEGKVELLARDTREPSPFAYQLINSFPYAFLDDGDAENRRTRAVSTRPALSVNDLQDLDRMEPTAISQVLAEAWPDPASADEFYEVLMATPAFPVSASDGFRMFLKALVDQKRITEVRGENDERSFHFWVAAESLPLVKAAYPTIRCQPELPPLPFAPTTPERSLARQAILKGWLEINGPVATEVLSDLFALENPSVYLQALEAEGTVLQCRMERQKPYTHWCARGLLRRIHRRTVDGLREQIRPVAPADYLEFIFEEHGLNLAKTPTDDSPVASVQTAIEKLAGFEASALAWEKELLASRVPNYESRFLDELTARGKVAFGRLSGKKADPAARAQKVNSSVPLTFGLRRDLNWLSRSEGAPNYVSERISAAGQQVYEALQREGALFVDELEQSARLLESQVESGLSELVGEGLVTSDQFQAFRILLRTTTKIGSRRKNLRASLGGRWSLVRTPEASPEMRAEQWARLLLKRYGIVFRDLLERETLAPSWGELVRVYRRWEARGELRGGRFITGVSGEQYGYASTHERLIQIRKERAEGKRSTSFAVISSHDPLNLIGVMTKEPRIAASPHTRLLFEAGELTAVIRHQEITKLKPISEMRLRALRLTGALRRKAGETAPRVTVNSLAFEVHQV